MQGDGNKVQGNKVGTNAAGTADLGNSLTGVWMYIGSSNFVGVDGDSVGDSTEWNLISGNNTFGVYFQGNSDNNVVAGNLIGTNADGTGAIGNTSGGIGFLNDFLGDNNRIGTDANGTSDNLERNLVSGNLNYGIVDFGVGTKIRGNYVGTEIDGISALANLQGGVSLGSSGAIVGGTNVASRNVISGNAGFGLAISDATGTLNMVLGNYIGVDSDGVAAVPNSTSGILIQSGANNNTIGGITAAARNVISGNTASGVEINGVGTSSNVVSGNYIGTNATGGAALGNVGDGVRILSGATNNRVGGSTLGERNVISGQTGSAGVTIIDSGTSGNKVQGNYIGTDAAGTAAVGNTYGVFLFGSATGNYAGTDGDGVGDSTEGNLISGNTTGVWVQADADNNIIAGNKIGTKANGSEALSNTQSGIRIFDSSVNGTRIGTDSNGTSDGEERNVISGNTSIGVYDSGGIATVIAGNYVGLDLTGETAIGGQQVGIALQGATLTEVNANVVSGHSVEGISVAGVGTADITIKGNLVGTDKDGATAIANATGIAVGGGATNITIGGSVPAARNIISGNTLAGISLSANSNTVSGNYIGTDVTGTAAVPNLRGIDLSGTSNFIGTNGDGANDGGERNVISGNTTGILIGGSNNRVAGNYIGTNAAGNAAIPNNIGVEVFFSSGNYIGTDGSNDAFNANERNVISGNTNRGVIVVGANFLAGNYIGLNAAGTAAIANAEGVQVTGTGARVGTNADGIADIEERNVISGNVSYGIAIRDATTQNAIIAGNYIGTNAAGTSPIPNADGIIVSNGAHDNTIGGLTAISRNVISGNTQSGVLVHQVGTTQNTVAGNYIGTNATGTSSLANGTGVTIQSAATNNTIGGTAAGARNVISGNTTDGVTITGTGVSGNVVQGNYIGTNVAGSGAVGNSIGVAISAPNNTVGGATAASRNIISGNTSYGVVTSGTVATGNVIQNNFIGTDLTGEVSVGNSIGASIQDGANTIRDNLISGNSGGLGHGVFVSGPAVGTVIAGNIIGLSATGATVGNAGSGVLVSSAPGVDIGGLTASDRNVIGGNSGVGVWVTGAGAIGTLIRGNYIGTNAAGTAAKPNPIGVLISGGAANNTIGGIAVGSRNVISGNGSDGVTISDSGTIGNVVQGNYIGTNAAGTEAVGNVTGVQITDGANNTIGGNVISGNTGGGLGITGSTATGNLVLGNIVGLNAAGTADLGNVTDGVAVFNASGNTIGGTAPGAGNVISGNNARGVVLGGNGSTGNFVLGNLIGTDITGTIDLGNDLDGVFVSGGNNNTIGGTTSAARNIISGNNRTGIRVTAGADGTTIQGNYIGTNAAGTGAIGNTIQGVLIGSSTNVLVGGTSAGAGNVISGNVGCGVEISGGTATANTVAGNLIGTNATGTEDLGNGVYGVLVDGANNNLIGGNSSVAGNVISGNDFWGVWITGGATQTRVQGNFVGTNRLGDQPLPNGGGVYINGSTSNTIGGSGLGEGNVISGNAGAGVFISQASSIGNSILGNTIGLKADLSSGLGNGGDGITVHSAGFNTIGGAGNGRNIISSNAYGIDLFQANGVQIFNNWIGLNGGGAVAAGNTLDGIVVEGGSNHIIGSATSGLGNVISGQGRDGIRATASTGAVIEGNSIGTDVTGTLGVGNLGFGISMLTGAFGNRIGGATQAAANTIASNQLGGIHFNGSGSNSVQVNSIGTDLSGSIDLGNVGPGVMVSNSPGPITIGGVLPNQLTKIAFNSVGAVVGSNATRVTLRGSSFYSNDGLGIDLGGDGITANDDDDPDAGANGRQNYPQILTVAAGATTTIVGQLESNPNSMFTIDYFASTTGDPSGFGEGKRYLGSQTVTTASNGLVALNHTLASSTTHGERISAIATDNLGNTSEFSEVVVAVSTELPTIDPNNLILTELRPENLDGYGTPTLQFTEGNIVRMDGLFANLDVTDAHTVRIDWGDGTPENVIAVSPGPRGFTAEHVYADDRPSATNQDTYIINVFVTDDDNASGVASIAVTVVNEPAAFVGTVTLTPSALSEGGTAILAGSFVDPGADVHRLLLDWGDGGGLQIVTLPLGARTFSIPHTFRDDASSVTVTLVDDDTVGTIVPDSRTLSATVGNLPPAPNINAPGLGIEGSQMTFLGSVVDPGVGDLETFVWQVLRGGTTILESTTSGNSLNYTPEDEGAYVARLIATDDEGASGATDHAFTVLNQAPVLLASDLQLRLAGGGPVISVVPEGRKFELTGSFTDGGINDTHQVTIDWGDGSTPLTLTLPRGARAFSADYTYADDNPTGTSIDNYPIRVEVKDNANQTGSVTRLTPVANSAPVAQIVDNGSDDTTIRLRAQVRDDSALDTFVYSWTIPGVTLPTTTVTNLATIEFLRSLTSVNGFAQASVTVIDDDGGADTASAIIVLGTNNDDLITVAPSTSTVGNVFVSVVTGAVTSTADFPPAETVVVMGRDRHDMIVVSSTLSVNMSIDGGIGNDTVTSSSGNDTITGGEGNDSIVSGTGHDVIDASDGNDTVNSGGGDDTVEIDEFSDKTLIDSSGIDTIDFSGVSTASVDTVNGVSLNLGIDNGTMQTVRTGGGVSLLGTYENVVGTQFKDSLIGNSASNLLFGGPSDDTIQSGAGGNDSIDGGIGDDSITGGGGNDLIFGGGDDDTLQAGLGDDSIDAGDGNDLIFGGTVDGNDTISGGIGDDSIAGGDGDDLIFGGADQDTITSGVGDDSIDGGEGNDLIFGGTTVDQDTIQGGLGNDSIAGGAGDDLIFGGDGNDSITSGAGNESIQGGDGNDLIFGGDNDSDTIEAGLGNDSIVGGDGTGDDLIFGGDGNDTIQTGASNESIIGGSGDDLIFGGEVGNDTILGGTGDDSIDAGQGDDLIFGGADDDTIQAGLGNESIDGGTGDDLIFGGGLGADTIQGSAGDDSITGAEGDDLIFGGDDNDSINGGLGDDSIDGGAGDDLIFGGSTGDVDTIRGGLGDDSITGGHGDDLIFGGDGADTISSGLGNESIDAGAGDDLIFGGATDGQDTIRGGLGDDSIAGGAGNDLIFGDGGDDTVSSGLGNESIDAGAGDDLIFGGTVNDQDTIQGGLGDDSIEGGAGDDLIFGGEGEDTIRAGLGDESIDGGTGDDLIFGGSTSDDLLPGGTSDDSIVGGDGNDLIFGGDGGRDTVHGGLGDDSIEGGTGDDLIFGGDGEDTIRAGLGDESIDGGDGDDLIFGGTTTDDTLPGGTSNDSITGGDGDDLIFGGDAGNDTIRGGAGDDSIVSGDGNDLIFGDGQDDTIQSGLGQDTIDGGSGVDLIFANVDTNATLTATGLTVVGKGTVQFVGIESAWLRGNANANTISASAAALPVILEGSGGNDLLTGGANDDVFVGGGGNDTLVGGNGNDTYRFDGSSLGTDRVDESTGNGEDTLDFAGHAWAVTVDLGVTAPQVVSPGLTLTLVGAIENAYGTEFNDSLTGNSLANKLFGVNGNDTLIGMDGSDTLSAGRRRVVYLDFDSASEVGEHVYSPAERTAILNRMMFDYRMFDVEFTTTQPTSGPYARVVFNAAVFNPLSAIPLGGISERVGWRELDGAGSVQVDVNSFLGVGTNKLPATTENIVALSSTIGSHELAHFYGVRHQDAFGSPGNGIFPGLNNQSRFRPTYTGPTSANETRYHLSASPASIRTTLVDALGNPFFGEREALKIAFGESGQVIAEQPNASKTGSLTIGTSTVPVQALGSLPALSVPNTVEIGVNQSAGPNLGAAAIGVTGIIELTSALSTATSESDYYSISGSAGDAVTIEVMSQVLRHRIGNPIESILRVYDAAGQKIPYHANALGAFNDDTFENTDSVLIDLVLPSTGTFTIEVDTFSFAAPEFASYMPAGFNIAQFSIDNPTHVAVTDRDTGAYELLVYRFSGSMSAVNSGDTIVGGTGEDILVGNSGKETIYGYVPGFDQLFDPSGGFINLSNPPVMGTIPNQSGSEGSPVGFTATANDVDGDFQGWRLEPVVGQNYPTGATINASTGVFSFTPPDNGSYAVRVVAEDLGGMTDSQNVFFTIANVAPTVSLSGPSSLIAGNVATVTSTVSDPAGANDPLTYAWNVTRNASPFASHTGGTSYSFTPALAGTYVVSLTVNDGDGGITTSSPPVTITVSAANTPPTLVIEPPTDGEFGVASLFKFRATDPDVVDQSGTFTYTINWGDGSPVQTVTGPSVTTVSHTYSQVSSIGQYTITGRAQDARGALGPQASAAFIVLGWTVMADPANPGDAILVIVGSQGDDDVKVKDKSGDYLKVKIKNRDDQVKYKATIYDDVDRILVFGFGGADKIRIYDDIDVRAEIWGGAGNDELQGGAMNDLLLGESGNDALDGGGGRDILIGGTGADSIKGGNQDDILIAGLTAFDQEFNQLAPASFPPSSRLSLNDQRLALEAILAEWGSNRSYAVRRSNLIGPGSGTRLNGTRFLKFGESTTTNNTVFDDAAVDRLWGEAGTDWYLANTDGPTSLRDQVNGRASSEALDDIDVW